VIETSESAFHMLTEKLAARVTGFITPGSYLFSSLHVFLLLYQHNTRRLYRRPKISTQLACPRSFHEMAPLNSSSSASTQSGDALMIALHEATTAKIDEITAKTDAILAKMDIHHSQTSAQFTRFDQNLSEFKADLARAHAALGLQIENAGDRLLAAIAKAKAPSDAPRV
jgi:hypothetical protein